MESDENNPIHQLAVELIEPNHWVAYALDLPGCFSSGKTETTAIEGAPERIRTYLEWLSSRGEQTPIPESIRVRVAERYVPPDQLRQTSNGDNYIINAFFRHDSQPLSEKDVERALAVLSHQREELLSLLPSHVPPRVEVLLLHIGSAEWWYWDRIDSSFPREDLPEQWDSRLSMTREFTLAHLPFLIDRKDVNEKMGEGWSGRKIVRRCAWHERDHTNQIALLLGEGITT